VDVMPEFKSILPSNSTLLEQNIERVNHALPVPLRELWRVDSCPSNLLPWLAWSLSVDVWDEQWSEEIKRNVIRNSVEIHKHKGTLYAVELAIESLGVDATVTEWGDSNEIGRGRFNVDILASDKGIDSGFKQKALRKFIDRSKRLSADYAITANEKIETEVSEFIFSVTNINDRKGPSKKNIFPTNSKIKIVSFGSLKNDNLIKKSIISQQNLRMGFFSFNHVKKKYADSLVKVFSALSLQEIKGVGDKFKSYSVVNLSSLIIAFDNKKTNVVKKIHTVKKIDLNSLVVIKGSNNVRKNVFLTPILAMPALIVNFEQSTKRDSLISVFRKMN